MTNFEQAAVSTAPGVEPGYQPSFLGEDDDYALGCECANPALQIERWGQDDAPAARQFY